MTIGGWTLTPEGAAVHRETATAVVADVHLGYEWARGAGGDMVPPHSLSETTAKLAALRARVAFTRLVVAGDLVETAKPCARTAGDVRSLTSWLRETGAEPVFLKGNHDPPRRPPLPPSIEVGGWRVSHGDRPLPSGRCMVGHHHPALRAAGVVAPCFLVGEETIVLPAFSKNAAGFDVATGWLPEALKREPLRCIAAAGDELLDFGPLASLAQRLS